MYELKGVLNLQLLYKVINYQHYIKFRIIFYSPLMTIFFLDL